MVADFQGQKLGAILIAIGAIEASHESEILEYAGATACAFGVAAVKLGHATEAAVARGLSLQSGAPSVALGSFEPDESLSRRLTAQLAWKLLVLPLSIVKNEKGTKLVVAIARPLDVAALDELAFAVGASIAPVVARDTELTDALTRVYGAKPEPDRRRRVDLGDGPGLEHVVRRYAPARA